MRVILDTNVLVSGLLSRTGPPARVLDAVIDGRLTAVFSPETLAEFREVINRPRLRPYLTRAKVDPQAFMKRLAEIAEMTDVVPCNLPIRDPKDRPFLSLAAGARPDFLVTGDKDFTADRYAGVPVITAALLARSLD